MLNRIAASRHALRRSERKVADWILAQPHATIAEPIAGLALKAGVSEPTVIRFCRALGCDGYQSFKLRLAQSLAAGIPFIHREVVAGDHGRVLSSKLFNGAIAALIRTRDSLDPDALDQAVTLLAGARSIHCLGHGASGIVAQDAQHKLFRLGVPVVAYTDPHVHCMAAATLAAGDVVLAVSHTGRSKDVINSVRLALEGGARAVGLSAAGSPLARLVTVNLDSAVREDTDTWIPMTSRLADLAIVDVLAVGVALERGPELVGRLERTKRVVADGYLKL